MSNNNHFWGYRYGSIHKDGSRAFRISRGSVNGSSNSGKAKNHPETIQSKRDKAQFQLRGRPVLTYSPSGRRIRNHG